MEPISTTDEWKALATLAQARDDLDLRGLFAADPGRADRLTLRAGDLRVDLSKNLITGEVLDSLIAVARRVGLPDRVEELFGGEHVNVTEDRAVLHPALRGAVDDGFVVDGREVGPDVHGVLEKMSVFAGRVRAGEWRGHTGARIRHVVNIGIGGSDLGPAMAHRALRSFVHPEIDAHFVSNVDPADLEV